MQTEEIGRYKHKISGTVKKERESSFELLRIISMFSIVICHFASHGGFVFDAQTLSIPRAWWYFIEMGGNFGVDVFVLISGYFLIDSKKGFFDIKRILKFWGQVFFYSVILYFVFIVFGVSSFSIGTFISILFPIISGQWWFASTYFVLFLLHPFLNYFLIKLDKRHFQNFIILLFVIWCIIPTFTFKSFESNSLLWFITLYCIAAYIRLYGFNPKISIKHYFFAWIVFSLLRYFSSIILVVIGNKVEFFSSHTLAFYGQQSILTLLSALSLFMVFKNLKMRYHKWINVIALATFGVYLIHENNYMRAFLWKTLFKNSLFQDSNYIILYSVGVAFVVYFTCTIVDLIRQYTIEKLFLYFVNKCSGFFNKFIIRISNFFRRIL